MAGLKPETGCRTSDVKLGTSRVPTETGGMASLVMSVMDLV